MSNALIVMLVIMGGTMLLRAPISFGMLAGGVGYLVVKGQDVGLMAEQVLNGLYNSYVLLAVPLFILAASIMNAGAISERLFAMAIALVGHFRGGLAYVNVIVSVIFSGMSGSAIADAAGPGLVSIRMMTEKNRFSPSLPVRLPPARRPSARSFRRPFQWSSMRWCQAVRSEPCSSVG